MRKELLPKTIVAITLDVSCIIFLFYIALKTMSLLMWVLLMMLVYVFCIDLCHAIKFVKELLKK